MKRVNSLVQATKDSLTARLDDVAKVVDVSLSAAIESDVVDKVPLVSVAVKVLKFRDEFYKNRFKRNCQAFLTACQTADQQSREAALNEIMSDEQNADDFTDTLITILQESEKPLKATITGNLIAAVARKKITYSEYKKLALIIHAGSVPALLAVADFVETYGESTNANFDDEPLLLSIGLATKQGYKLRISYLGSLLYEHGFLPYS